MNELASRKGTVALRLLRVRRSKIAMPAGLDSEREVVEGGAQPLGTRNLGGDVIVAAAQVLHKGMTRSENLDGAPGTTPPAFP